MKTWLGHGGQTRRIVAAVVVSQGDRLCSVYTRAAVDRIITSTGNV